VASRHRQASKIVDRGLGSSHGGGQRQSHSRAAVHATTGGRCALHKVHAHCRGVHDRGV